MTGAPFRNDSFTETAREFHARDLLSDPTPRVVECHTTGSALVLGSAQPFSVCDDEAVQRHGIDVTRRRSGGGAVLVVPDALAWFDVVVPGDDPRFGDVAGDVSRSMRWLGGHVLAALGALGVDDTDMHVGPMKCNTWCRLVCFAGTAAGEIELGGRKLVGISQRRTRTGSRFQCAVHTRWAPDLMLSLLAPPRPTEAELAPVATLDAAIAGALPGALLRVLNAL